MEYNITIETVEMNNIRISSEDAPTGYYDLANWTVGAAVENYINEELSE